MNGGNKSRELDSLLVGIAPDFLARRCAATRPFGLVLDPHITFLHWVGTHDFPCAFLFQGRGEIKCWTTLGYLLEALDCYEYDELDRTNQKLGVSYGINACLQCHVMSTRVKWK